MKFKFAILLLVLGSCNSLFAWENKKTHPAITSEGIKVSAVDGYLKTQMGMANGIATQLYWNFPSDIETRMTVNDMVESTKTKTILDWLNAGSSIEDEDGHKISQRCRHHFYDPTRNAGLDNHTAYPTWTAPFGSSWLPLGASALDWATDGSSSYEPYNNDEKWINARAMLYLALTDDNEVSRKEWLAKTFLYLGEALHLLEDMGVPAHTRNDFLYGHYRSIYKLDWGNDLEGDVEAKIIANGDNSLWSGSGAVAFDKLAKYFDTGTRYDLGADDYLGNGNTPPNTWGLSEATNYQFLSLSTVFGSYMLKYYFPHPSKYNMITPPITESYGQGTKLYFNGSNYGVLHMARQSYTDYKVYNDYLGLGLPPQTIEKVDSTVTTDDSEVFEDYAEITIPRTIDYTTGLANYFFRGRLESEITDWNSVNHKIEITIKNKSINSDVEQTLKGGTFELYWDDKDGGRTPITGFVITGGWNSSSTLAYDVNAIITFTKPAGAEPVKYIAIYKGNICQNPAQPDNDDANAIAVSVLSPGFKIVAWGNDTYSQVSGVPQDSNFIAVAAGKRHGLALTSDGKVQAWGSDAFGQCSGAPDGNDFFIAVAAGARHSIALKSDGSIVVWGDDTLDQITDAPTGNDFVAIVTGEWHSLARKSDGSVVGWGGYNTYGECDAPTPDTGTTYTAISAGFYHSIALQSDGIPKAWGNNAQGQTSFYSGVSGVAAVAASYNYNLILRDDKWLTSWGGGDWLSPGVPRYHYRPYVSDESPFVKISAGYDHILALTSDGEIFSWTWPFGNYTFDYFLKTDVPAGIVFSDGSTGSPQASISAGNGFSLALKAP